MPLVQDVFKQMRTERKGHKNVRIFLSRLPVLPPIADESGFFICTTSNIEDSMVSAEHSPKLKGNQLATSPSFTTDGDSKPSVKFGVSQDILKTAIATVADIYGLSVDEFQNIGTSSLGMGSLGLDSLMSKLHLYPCFFHTIS